MMMRALLFATMAGVSHGTIQTARHVVALEYPSTTLEISGPVTKNHTMLCAKTDKYAYPYPDVSRYWILRS